MTYVMIVNKIINQIKIYFFKWKTTWRKKYFINIIIHQLESKLVLININFVPFMKRHTVFPRQNSFQYRSSFHHAPLIGFSEIYNKINWFIIHQSRSISSLEVVQALFSVPASPSSSSLSTVSSCGESRRPSCLSGGTYLPWYRRPRLILNKKLS